MKQLGYVALLLLFIMIILPFILVRGCSQNDTIDKPQKKSEERWHTIKVYIKEEDSIVEMDFNDYLKGVVAAEMPASFNIEALKAQAVAARTYAYRRVQNHQEAGIEISEHKGADICTDSTHCKAWITKETAMDKWGMFSGKKYWQKISTAVDDTANIIVTYQNEPIDAVFHSTSSGRTENSEDVWTNIIPYLRSTVSEGEEYSPKYTSKVEISIHEFESKLKQYSPEIILPEDNSTWIGNVEKTEGGSVKIMMIGDQSFRGVEIRKIFELNSADFEIDVQDENVVFNVIGNGHGVGMSQYGANYLAQQGKTYEEILKFYYKDVDVELITD